MKLYRVHYYSGMDSSEGFAWFTSRAQADADARQYKAKKPEDHEPEVQSVEFKSTKRGILALLERYAAHPDNG